MVVSCLCLQKSFIAIIVGREDVGEDVGVVECGLYAIVCVVETSDIVGVTSVGETSVLLADAHEQRNLADGRN